MINNSTSRISIVMNHMRFFCDLFSLIHYPICKALLQPVRLIYHLPYLLTPAERKDLLAEYQQRYDIMSEYAPAMLSEEEVRKILTEKFADVIATKNKGQIMKTVMPELKGKADGKLIGQVVAELCK